MKKYKIFVLSLFLTVLYGCQSGNDSLASPAIEDNSQIGDSVEVEDNSQTGDSAEEELAYFNDSVHLFSDQVYKDILSEVLWRSTDERYIRSVTIKNSHKSQEFNDVDELLNYQFSSEDWMEPGDYRDQFSMSLSYRVNGEKKNVNVDLFLYNAQEMTYQQLFTKVMDEMYFLPDDPKDMTAKDHYFYEHKEWNKPTALCWDRSVEQCSGPIKDIFHNYPEDAKNREDAIKIVAANFAMHKYAVHTRYYADSIVCINGENREPCTTTGGGTFYNYHTNYFGNVDPDQQAPYVTDASALMSDSSVIDKLHSRGNLIETLLRVRNIGEDYRVNIFGASLEGWVPLRPIMPLDKSLTAKWVPSNPEGQGHNASFGTPLYPSSSSILGGQGARSAPSFQHEMMHSLGFTHKDENGKDRQSAKDYTDDFVKQAQIRSMDMYTRLYTTIARRMDDGVLTVPVNDDLEGVSFY